MLRLHWPENGGQPSGERIHSRLEWRLVAALAILGAVLRVRQYTGGGALWLDELALARNILDRPLASLLTKPLAYDQLAPPGFVLLEKLAVLAFGSGEWQLRLVPLLSSLAALGLFPFLAARLLKGAGFVVAVALFALNVPLIWLGAQVKPYTTDLVVAVALTALALRWQRSRHPKDAVLLAIVGCGAVWLSTPAVLVLAGLAGALGLGLWAERDTSAVWTVGLVAVAWSMASAAAAAAALARISPVTHAYLREFWTAGFPPTGARRGLVVWPWHAARSAFSLMLGYPWTTGYAAIAAVGAVSFRRWRDSALLVGPVAATLGAAMARQYPFHSRVVLFLAPALICLVAAGIEYARSQAARLPALGAIVVVAACLPALWTVRLLRSVSTREEVRPILAGVRAAWHPGDVLYVHYSAWQAAEFYAPRYGFTRADIRLGGCYRDGDQRYTAELDQLRGRPRVWVLFTHATWREAGDLLAYLDRIGTPRDSVLNRSFTLTHLKPPSAYLFDLAAADRPAGVRPPAGATSRLGEPRAAPCEGGPGVPRPTPGVDSYW